MACANAVVARGVRCPFPSAERVVVRVTVSSLGFAVSQTAIPICAKLASSGIWRHHTSVVAP